jgi:hypothetical protein
MNVPSLKSILTALVATPIVACFLFGCETTPKTTLGRAELRAKMLPVDIPQPITTLDVWDKATNHRVEKDVLSLKPQDIRDMLTATRTFVTVQQYDASGGLTYLTSGANVSKGMYRVTFDYVNFRNEDISLDDGSKILGTIAVGVRITAELQTLSSGVNISGLLPIGVAFKTRT